jgi:hypothetical protein
MRSTLAALGVLFAMGCSHMIDGNAQTAGGGAPPDMIEAMRSDAATRAGVAASAVKLESVLGVTWRDASLGCPRPGMVYPQVLVPGWRVRIVAGGKTYSYHAGRRGNWAWCPADRSQEPLPSSSI